MQSDINHTVVTGRLTRDPELRASRSGKPVATLRVAIQRRPGVNGTDRGAVFADVEVWNGLAQTCARYLAKGRRVAIEAHLEHSEWTVNDSRREKLYLVGDDVKFLDAPPQGVHDEDAAEPAAEPAAA